MKSEHTLFVGRQEELKLLDRYFALSHWVILVGLKGIGKSTLARYWLSKQKVRSHFILCDGVSPFHKLLGIEGCFNSAESTLEAWKNQVENQVETQDRKIIVWEDFHRFPPTLQKLVCGYIHSRSSANSHFILSDEQLEVDAPQLRLSPLTGAEIRSYLEKIGESSISEQKVLTETGGIPLLVTLFLQSRMPRAPLMAMVEKILNPEAKRILAFLATRLRGFTVAQLSESTQLSAEPLGKLIEELVRLNLVEFYSNESDLVRLPPYLFSLVRKSLSKTELEENLRKALPHIDAPLERFFVASTLRDDRLMIESASQVDTDLLEQLPVSELESFGSSLNRLAASSLPVHVIRLLCKIKFSSGARKEALRVSRQQFETIESFQVIDRETSIFILEHLQLLNRNDEFKGVLKLEKPLRASPLMRDTSNPIGALIGIELSSATLRENPAQGSSVFDPIYKQAHGHLIQTSTQASKDREWKRVAAQVGFQRARIYQIEGNTQGALSDYESAEKFYQELELFYLAAIAKLNRAWILSNDFKWDELAIITGPLRQAAGKFSYSYALSGLDLIEASRERLHGRFAAALRLCDQALNQLGSDAPALARLDAGIEKATTLAYAGMREAALQIKSAVRILKSEIQTRIFQERFQELELVTDDADLTLEQINEVYVKQKRPLEYYFQRATRGEKDQSPAAVRAFESGPLGRLLEREAVLLVTIADGMGESARAEVYPILREMDQILLQFDTPTYQALAVKLLRTKLEDPAQRERLIAQVRSILLICTWEAEIKDLFLLWTETLESGQSFQWNDPRWRRLRPGDRERWSLWLKPCFSEAEARRWELIQGEKRTELHSQVDVREFIRQSTQDGPQLFVDETNGEVYLNGKTIAGFKKQTALRRILGLLVEAGDKGFSKEALASQLWSGKYNPQTHDARLYVSIQRARSLLKRQSLIEIFESHYRWDPRTPASLYRELSGPATSLSRQRRIVYRTIENLILNSESGSQGVSRSEIAECLEISPATLKRELAYLLDQGLIKRRGSGSAIKYYI